MQAAILAAGLLALGVGDAAAANQGVDQSKVSAAAETAGPAESAEIVPAAILRATAPPNADPARTYDEPGDALLQADLDYLIREARRAIARGETESIWPTLVFVDEFASDRLPEARRVLEATPGGVDDGISDLLEPFLLAAEGRVDAGVERVDSTTDDLPAPLPDVARALLFESAGRYQEAAAVYAQMETYLDLTPPPQSEPTSAQEWERALNAARVTHSIYRAALVEHRLGNADNARRLYGVVTQFAPRSADVQRNLERLGAGEGPFEPELDVRRAAGRWLLFLSEFLTQAEALTNALAENAPQPGLASASGSMFLQMGIALEPGAEDWRLYAANELVDAGGLDAAGRVIDLMPTQSVFSPDADIVRAQIAIERNNDAEAMAAAQRALGGAGDRWAVVASAGDIYRQVGRPTEAISAFDRALTMVDDNEDRADILGWRAYAHRYAGNQRAATADVTEALRIDPSVETRMLYVSILMEDAQNWDDGIRVARELFAEQPDSVLRLNALGYALIQRPEGLEEGYRLLWRGFNWGQNDYAVVDSLGWAYYKYGAFEEALALIERANELSRSDPNAEILDHLGDVYWRLDRRDDARRTWQEALDARPEAERRRDLETKVRRGLTEAAPRRQQLPRVSLPDSRGERGDL